MDRGRCSPGGETCQEGSSLSLGARVTFVMEHGEYTPAREREQQAVFREKFSVLLNVIAA